MANVNKSAIPKVPSIPDERESASNSLGMAAMGIIWLVVFFYGVYIKTT